MDRQKPIEIPTKKTLMGLILFVSQLGKKKKKNSDLTDSQCNKLIPNN